jgi:hypothetical protein
MVTLDAVTTGNTSNLTTIRKEVMNAFEAIKTIDAKHNEESNAIRRKAQETILDSKLITDMGLDELPNQSQYDTNKGKISVYQAKIDSLFKSEQGELAILTGKNHHNIELWQSKGASISNMIQELVKGYSSSENAYQSQLQDAFDSVNQAYIKYDHGQEKDKTKTASLKSDLDAKTAAFKVKWKQEMPVLDAKIMGVLDSFCN